MASDPLLSHSILPFSLFNIQTPLSLNSEYLSISLNPQSPKRLGTLATPPLTRTLLSPQNVRASESLHPYSRSVASVSAFLWFCSSGSKTNNYRSIISATVVFEIEVYSGGITTGMVLNWNEQIQPAAVYGGDEWSLTDAGQLTRTSTSLNPIYDDRVIGFNGRSWQPLLIYDVPAEQLDPGTYYDTTFSIDGQDFLQWTNEQFRELKKEGDRAAWCAEERFVLAKKPF